MKLIGNGTLITQNAANPLIENGCVVVDGERILDFGTTADMKAKYPDHEWIDAQGKLIMPGFINAHSHIYSALARGMNIPNSPVSKNFMDILENLWWRMDKKLDMDEVRASAYATYVDSIKKGVTTLFDHHASMTAVEGSLFAIEEVAKELGIRTSLCYEVTDRDGEAVAKATVKENIDFIRHAQKQNSDMVKGMLGLHASFTVNDKLMEACVNEMGDMNAGYHVHVAEGLADVQHCLAHYGKRVVERLYNFGILGEKSIAVHCIHINPAEMDMLKDTNTMVVHNPQSNMGNAVGCSAVIEMIRRGLLVGMGTDAYTNDMLESMKVTNILHKHHLCDPSVAWGEPPQMLFENNRKIAARFFKTPVGIIEKGAAADIIMLKYTSPTPILASNLGGHFQFGPNGNSVDSTMINGKMIYQDGKMLNIDEAKVFADVRKQAEKLWARI